MSLDLSIEESLQTFDEIPGPKGNFLTGNLSQIKFEQFHQYVKEKSQEYGSIFRLAFAHKPVIVVSDPEVVRYILKNRPDKFRRITAIEAVFEELGVNGVFSSEGEQWLVQRKMMNQAFKTSQIENYYPIISNTTARFLGVMNDLASKEETVDIQALLQRYTVDITTNLAFGYDVNSLSNSDSEFQQQINHIFPMLSNRIKAPIPYWRYFKLKKDKDLDKSIEFIKELSTKFIQTAEDKINPGQLPENILQAMILARDEKGNSFNHEKLFANIITLLLAGEDTTANTLSWVIHYLVENPEIQDTLYHEIIEKSASISLTDADNLDQFPTVSAVIQEAMRLMPVAPFTYLENYAQENIAGYKIPKGTMIVVLLSQTGHDPDVFKEPEKFDPQRWLTLSVEEKKKLSKELMHFGSGARQCPGMQLSLLEMKCALISLFKQFIFFRANDSKKTEDYFAFTVMPKNLNVMVRRREQGEKNILIENSDFIMEETPV